MGSDGLRARCMALSCLQWTAPLSRTQVTIFADNTSEGKLLRHLPV